MSFSMGYFRDREGGASTSLAAPVERGATSISVASDAGFAAQGLFPAADLIRIGSGRQLEEAFVDPTYVSGTTIPLRAPTAYAHAVGEAVVEREKIVLYEDA